jgi:hypothetical protein
MQNVNRTGQASPPSPDVRPGGVYVGANPNANPSAIYQGAVAARRELNDQRNNLQSDRHRLAEQLRDPMVTGADRAGLEAQIGVLDAQITTLDKDVAAANARVASTALVPGAVVEPKHNRDGPPEEVYIMGGLFMVTVLLPLSVAFAIRLLRRGRVAVNALPQEILERFSRLDQAVDAMAVEIERIGEGQRFVTRVISERAPEPAKLERGSPSRQ